VVLRGLPVVQTDEPVTGADEVGVALGREPVGAWVLVLEVVVDDDPRRERARRGGTTRVVPPRPLLARCGQEPVSS
jgi:hypothetical protein